MSDVNMAQNATEIKSPRHAAADFVTVLSSDGTILAKRWHLVDGEPESLPYDRAMWFNVAAHPVGSLDNLHRVIAGIGPRQSLILGKLRDGVDPHNVLRRMRRHAGEAWLAVRYSKLRRL